MKTEHMNTLFTQQIWAISISKTTSWTQSKNMKLDQIFLDLEAEFRSYMEIIFPYHLSM